ncbi:MULTISPECIES: TerD family protein [Streptomyces]|uniref:Stress protein n=3 Tax=Streptomyces TaxID=1883 RepID=A0A3M8FBS7_9ACTN|nr:MULTISPECIES: TerD family protein [Streptomyces]KNE81470.1 stress protein [Streptomyces fradiae]PQM24185.1 stress protein [Streptomyces xinghaiensis]RKM97149.1 stress protein [Streptomyces xinghaiensis]RNC75457.1 stress protein [Streptomyces xinghaiensis]
MAREFQRGHKARISDLTAGTDLYVGVQISGPGLSFDISCFGLDADERLSDDRYFVFFNQPKSPEESIQLLGAQAGDTESFRVTLDRVSDGIHRLSFTATIDGAGQMSQVGPGYLRIVAGGEEVARYAFDGSEFSTERAVMLGDFYRKDVWRFAAVGQGFDGGLDALLKNFGGEVLEEETPEPQQSAPQQGGAVPGFAPPAAAPAAPPPFGAPAGPPPSAPQPAAPQPAAPQAHAPQAPPAPAPQATPPQFTPPPGPPPAPPAPQPAATPPHAGAPTIAAPLAPPGPAQPPGPPQPPAAPAAPYGPPPGSQAPFPGAQPPGAPAPYGHPSPVPGQPGPYGVPQGAGAAPAGLGNVLEKYREVPTGQRWTLQSRQLVRVDLGADDRPVLARQGSMVLYQGKVDFGYKGAGFAGRVVGNATGQEMQLMRCTGRGQVFLAEDAAEIHPIELQGDAICVSAENVLAFDESLQYEVRRIEGHGIPGGALFTMLFQGTGTVVVKTRGTPVVLPVTPTTFADSNAVVAWSAASQVIISSQVRLRRNAYPGHSGETVNLQFRGAPGNFIVVQPYEV